jgi:hypothetical protein
LEFEVTIGEAEYEKIHNISNEVVSNMLALEDQILASKQHDNAFQKLIAALVKKHDFLSC